MDSMDTSEYIREMPAIPEIPTFQALLDEIERCFEDDEIDVDYMLGVMNAYKSKPSEWKAYRKFDHRR